jgi:hypothetical protein
MDLPPGWTKEFSKSQQRPYYYHAASQTSKWELSDVIPATKRARLEPKLAIIVPYRDDASRTRSKQLDP